MNFKKISIALVLIVSFGLVACGNDSSASASSNTPDPEGVFEDDGSTDLGTCSVIHDGSTVGYEILFDDSTKNSLNTKTFNKDGTVTHHERTVGRGEYMTSVIESGCKNKRQTVEDHEDAEIEWIECKDGVMEFKYSIIDSEYNPAEMEDAIEYELTNVKYYCSLINNTSDDSNADDDDEETTDSEAEDSSLAPNVGDNSEDDPVKSYKCDVSMDKDTWTVTSSSDVVNVTEYVFEGSTVTRTEKLSYSVGSAAACSMYLEEDGDGEGSASCDGKMLTITYEPEVTENVDKRVLYENVKHDCDLMSSLYK